MNYFAMFGLEEKYDLSLKELKDKYLQLMQVYHPDRAQIGEAKEYIEKSMMFNEAYKILSDSYERAKYMLNLHGHKIGDNSILQPAELEQILEEYDSLETINSFDKLKDKELRYNNKIEMILNKIGESFSNNKLAEALDYTVRLKYFTNLVKNIKVRMKHANN